MTENTQTFFDEWSTYNDVLAHNYMLHDDIYLKVQTFFDARFGDRCFSLLDLGCGSALHLAKALKGRCVRRYVGYDLSEVALAEASRNLAALGCPVELRCGDLRQGLSIVNERFDVVFSSFALHHLASPEKFDFFRFASQTISDTGILLLIDTMRSEDESRDVYLERYCAWLGSRCQTLGPQAVDLLLAHIRSCDFPETESDIITMAERAGLSCAGEISRLGWHSGLWFKHKDRV
jgi:SAM-dependent methyltransferase